ncbi:EVE domain-containing protein [Synechococcus elongatus]|uniref:EVE domain-containing protein n=1 Tax=Synechococcus elongatus PCC 11801 TaxID=2219813 RepID=A0AAN1QQL2_SYNEL|nr:EVE domain-containing protein [Synechococcus elongatus]AZB73728.1 EVE domain-containing protein [Synechococcus elongatus PCC 11801]
MAFWLLKSEPDVYGIADLEREGETLWDGVRNYQARNFLRQMAVGDRAFFYHSNTKPPGIVGLMTVSATEQVDPSQFDPNSDYYDPRSQPDNPTWITVKLSFSDRFQPGLTLAELRTEFTAEDLLILRPGNRLSVTPVADPVADRLLQRLRSPAR